DHHGDHLQPTGRSGLFLSPGRLLFSPSTLNFSECYGLFQFTQMGSFIFCSPNSLNFSECSSLLILQFTLAGSLVLFPPFFLLSFTRLQKIHRQLICVTVACRPGWSRFLVLFPHPCIP